MKLTEDFKTFKEDIYRKTLELYNSPYKQLIIATKYGIVLVQTNSDKADFVRMMYANKGIIFQRLWEHVFAEITLFRLAYTFAEEAFNHPELIAEKNW